MKFSWQKLPKPFFALAPMEDVTDTVFRQIIISCGRPDVFFTEFTNCDALFSDGETSAMQRLQFTKKERPLIAQIWGMHPNTYYKAAKRLVEMDFDGIDINMGCPERSILKQGACSALIKNRPLAKEIIESVREGAGNLPVSVKTRLGFSEMQTADWIGFLLEQNLDALTVHARTVKEESKVPAHWDEIGSIVSLRDVMKRKTVIIGNGDVLDIADGLEKVKKQGVDGVMLGRAIFHNPFLFDPKHAILDWTPKQRMTLLKKHVELYEKTWGNKKHYPTLKKYFKIYIQGFSGASDMRLQFMQTNSTQEAIRLAREMITKYR
jgi:tRNA-dihydrouridine synthase